MLTKRENAKSCSQKDASHGSFGCALCRQIPADELIGWSPNSYGIVTPIANRNLYQFLLSGQRHRFEFPDGVIRPKLKETGNVIGCGILINPDDKLTIFFTLNGILAGQF
jgi:hypothetical protein